MDELVISGKRYISSKQAAKLTGYAKDYIGQLCRSGNLPARRVGRNWYVEEHSLERHKKKSKVEADQIRKDATITKTPAQYQSRTSYVRQGSDTLLKHSFPLNYTEDTRDLIIPLSRRTIVGRTAQRMLSERSELLTPPPAKRGQRISDVPQRGTSGPTKVRIRRVRTDPSRSSEISSKRETLKSKPILGLNGFITGVLIATILIFFFYRLTSIERTETYVRQSEGSFERTESGFNW